MLLTGATGFVGSHLHPALEAAGVPVRFDNYADMVHGFASMPGANGIDRAMEAVEQIADDLRDGFGLD